MTSLLESLHQARPEEQIDVLVRKGNESLLLGHPFIHEVLVWDKSSKYKSLLRLSGEIRKRRYDRVINIQRFGASGFLTGFSNAKAKIGFQKNPFSFLFTKKVQHDFTEGVHEIYRNAALISDVTTEVMLPKLYPSDEAFEKAETWGNTPYITLAPASVWETKALPEMQWVALANELKNYRVLLLGAPGDIELCNRIKSISSHAKIEVLAGKLNLLESAALMSGAKMNYVNDSAPLHLASAMNAPVTSFFCSTIPEFGFGPLSEDRTIAEVKEELNCRPCGLHGKKKCPEGHFKCGYDIEVVNYIPKA